MHDDPRRTLPSVGVLLESAELAPLLARAPRSLVTDTVRFVIEAARENPAAAPADLAAWARAIEARLTIHERPSLRPVINATGVVLHTNLGRAALSRAAANAVAAASGATDVELDLATGRRARRGRGALDALAAAVPEAEAVHVVNNGAAALVLVAASLAGDREIIISRGELVEIGDGFRIPDLVASTGARLREVGTTNRTTLDDYERALGPDTAMVLKVHPSNFVVTGFTSSVDVEALATLGVPVVVDIGSGLLQPHPRLPDEPDARRSLRAGAALVTASGDKLLGGPQCGLLLGRRDLVDAARHHPIARALRVDKLTLAALEATLRGPQSPTAAALATTYDDAHARASAVASRLAQEGIDAHAVDSEASVGGGGAPGVVLASAAVSLPEHYLVSLRTGTTPVIGRVRAGRCLLDLIAVDPEDDASVIDAVLAVPH
jgi:L-seryl-tRNA(Ser) seleniumtransferase